jgi:hypothetical protein
MGLLWSRCSWIVGGVRMAVVSSAVKVSGIIGGWVPRMAVVDHE